MYKIVALIGEAGTGKDTLMQSILFEHPDMFNEIISCTTRPMREGEAEGVNYFYLTDQLFKQKIDNNLMLEYTNFNNWYYGTSLDSLSKDKINIGVFNPTGIRSLLNHPEVKVITFKIFCNNKNRLIRQLNREEFPNIEEILRRYYADKEDFSNLEFEYTQLINETSKMLKSNVDKVVSVVQDTRWV